MRPMRIRNSERRHKRPNSNTVPMNCSSGNFYDPLIIE